MKFAYNKQAISNQLKIAIHDKQLIYNTVSATIPDLLL